jgi:hypothetical protein
MRSDEGVRGRSDVGRWYMMMMSRARKTGGGIGESRSVARGGRERRRLEEVEMRNVLRQQTLEVGRW